MAPSTPYRDVKVVCFCLLGFLALCGPRVKRKVKQSEILLNSLRNITVETWWCEYITGMETLPPYLPTYQQTFPFPPQQNVYVCEERNKADMKQWCLNKHQIGSCYAINHILSQSAAALFDSPVMWLGLWLWCHVTGWLVLCLDECFESCVFLTIFSGERKFYDANLVLERGQTQVQVSV